MIKKITCRANLFKEFIIGTVSEIINDQNTAYVTKSPEALEKNESSNSVTVCTILLLKWVNEQIFNVPLDTL